MTKSESNVLLSCPDCGADPVRFCTIVVNGGREPYDKNTASAQCHACGYSVSISTSGDLKCIRQIWNVRIR